MSLSQDPKNKPLFQQNLYYVGPNPSTPHCQQSAVPQIHPSAYIGPFACVMGNVTICENVFLAPHVTIRADEGTPFLIGANTNLQDGAIVHGLAGKTVTRNGQAYSIYIGEHVSLGHGCIVHGPCALDNHSFVGFGSLVLNAEIGEGSIVSHHAAVINGVHVPAGRIVAPGTLVDTQEKADALPAVSKADIAFTDDVQSVNNEFPAAYTKAFGKMNGSV